MNAIASFLAAATMAVLGGSATTTPAIAPVQACATITKVLQIGSRGDEVMKLQKLLGVESTGYFGALTQKKLIAWQISKKLIASASAAGAGTTGPKTRAAMKCVQNTVAPNPAVKNADPAPIVPMTPNPPAPVTPLQQSGGGGGGGGGSYVSPYGYTCTPPGTEPAASSCTTGSWQLIADEAGCAIWSCIDTDERG